MTDRQKAEPQQAHKAETKYTHEPATQRTPSQQPKRHLAQQSNYPCTHSNKAILVTHSHTSAEGRGTARLRLFSCSRSRPPLGPDWWGVHVSRAQSPSTRTAGGLPRRSQPPYIPHSSMSISPSQRSCIHE